MKKITPLTVDNKELFDDVVNMRHNPAKGELQEIAAQIKLDYDNYDSNKYNLEIMVPDSSVSAQADYLLNCYERGKKIDDIKKSIKDNIPSGIKGKCLYCMISEPHTLDHYLDKSEFPEFSIYTDNLLPICSRCNNKKGTKWVNGSDRLFINNYFDDIISDNYLFIDIGLSSGIPFVERVRLDFSGVIATKKQIDLVESHYKELDLIKRYKKSAIGLLETIVCELTEPTRENLSACEEAIQRKLNAFEKINGSNHWEAAVCRGILDNKAVMSWLSV